MNQNNINDESLDKVAVESIVHNIKYALEHGSHSEYLENIDEQIKEKNLGIEKICEENSTEFLENFKKFLIHKKLLSNFSGKIENFLEKIYKMSLRSKYDSSEINNKKKAIENIAKTLKSINEINEIFNLLNKSINNLSNEKYMASIRTISQIKKKSLISSQNSNSSMKNIVKEVTPLLIQQIKKKTDNFMSQWINYTKNKQKELGLTIISFYEESFQSNLSSFSINFVLNTNRKSLYFANNNSFLKQNEEFSRQEAFKDSFAPRYTMRPNKNNFEFSVDFHLLSQCQQIYESINEYVIFLENLKLNRTKELISLCDEPISIKEMRNFIAKIIGFFIIERELIKQFSNFNCIESFWLDALKKIEKNLGNTFAKLNNSNDFLEIKHYLHLFSYIVQKLGFQTQTNKILMIIKDHFLKFSEKLIQVYQPNVIEKINNDSFSCMKVSNSQEYEQLAQIFDGSFREIDSFSKETLFTFKFTAAIPEIVNVIMQFLQNNLSYFRGISDTEGLIHIQLDRFYFRVYEVFKELVDKKVLNIIQIGQTIENINYLENSLKFFQAALEKNMKIMCSREYESFFYLDQLKMTCEELIQELTKEKIDEFLQNYYNIEWNGKTPANKCNEFIQDLADFLLGVFKSLTLISSDVLFTLVYLSFRHINAKIFAVLCDEKIKHFNIIGLARLQLDILFLFSVCGDHLRQYENLMECLREIRQFLDLFFVGHPSDLLDLNLRKNKYHQINISKITVLFKKYKKIVSGKLPVIRKREVKATMDKLKLEIQKN